VTKKKKRVERLTTEFVRWVLCLECDHKYFIEDEVPRKNRCPVCGSYEYEEENEHGFEEFY